MLKSSPGKARSATMGRRASLSASRSRSSPKERSPSHHHRTFGKFTLGKQHSTSSVFSSPSNTAEGNVESSAASRSPSSKSRPQLSQVFGTNGEPQVQGGSSVRPTGTGKSSEDDQHSKAAAESEGVTNVENAHGNDSDLANVSKESIDQSGSDGYATMAPSQTQSTSSSTPSTTADVVAQEAPSADKAIEESGTSAPGAPTIPRRPSPRRMVPPRVPTLPWKKVIGQPPCDPVGTSASGTGIDLFSGFVR